MDFNNILVLAPHTDDGELGAGGTINKLIEQGSHVTYVAFSTADVPRLEVLQATERLGIQDLVVLSYEVRRLNYERQDILEEMTKIRDRLNPDLVFMPCLKDIHQDHSTVAQEGLRAFKGTSILGYELIWNNLSFNTVAFSKLEKRHIQAKADSLKEYKSQAERNYMSEDFIFSLAKTRGVQIGSQYAETFEVIRWLV